MACLVGNDLKFWKVIFKKNKMNKIKSIQILLLLTLASAFSCDKVRENPEPDVFLSSKLKLMEIVAEGGVAQFDILSENAITQHVNVSFSSPKHGSIIPESANSKFRYEAFKGFEGIDTVAYKICRTDFCKESIIRLHVTKNPPTPCFPVYGKDEAYTFRQYLKCKQVKYLIPFQPGDKYCPKNILKIDSYPTWVKNCKIIRDSIVIEIYSPLILSSLSGVITYSNCDTSNYLNACKTRTLNFGLDTSKDYCNNIFLVHDRPKPFEPRIHKTPRRYDFIKFVDACEKSIDMKFFDFYVTPNLFISWSHDENSCSIKKASPIATGPYYLHYIFRNNSGIKDTGRVEVKF